MFIAKKLNPKNITFNGISKGKKDEGIDLIVYNNNGTISLVQCKFRQKDLITENDIIKFIKDTQMYQFNHKRHAYYIEKLYFITSSNFTEEAKQIAVDKNINLIVQSPWSYK
jgi:predicted helicase